MRWLRSRPGQERGSSPHMLAGSAQPASFPMPSCGTASRPPAVATSSSLPALSVWNARSSVVSIWGGNASCVAAALWPERICGLVSYAGYDVIDVCRHRQPVEPSLERVFRYQHLFQTERGRECLTEHRRELCRLLWSEWSPGWEFDEATFARSAASFDN